MILPKKIITHENGSDNVFVGEEIFSSKDYNYKGKWLVVIKDKKKYFFKFINNDILYACSNLTRYVNKGDKFYCDSYEIFKDVRLSGGDWKNNQKDGKWYYRNKNEFSILTYKRGKIIKKEIISKNKPTTIPSYRIYPIR